AALAAPGEVLVSQTVRDLVAGSGLEFEERGAQELKGVPGEWRIYAVRPAETQPVDDALILAAVRSPTGRRDGGLSGTRGDELAARILNALVERNGVDPAEVDDVQMGCVTQLGEQGWNIGRMVPLIAGWPDTVCGTSVDRQCGSSMQTNFNA